MIASSRKQDTVLWADWTRHTPIFRAGFVTAASMRSLSTYRSVAALALPRSSSDPDARHLVDDHWLCFVQHHGFVAVTADPDTGAIDRNESCRWFCAAPSSSSHLAAGGGFGHGNSLVGVVCLSCVVAVLCTRFPTPPTFPVAGRHDWRGALGVLLQGRTRPVQFGRPMESAPSRSVHEHDSNGVCHMDHDRVALPCPCQLPK